MATIGVIGGTRFFGKALVRDLLAAGHEVTLITRGTTPDDFGDAVHRRTADATDATALAAAVDGTSFDVVYHQMCYSPRSAEAAVRALSGRTRRLVLTSSMEVYNRDTFRWEVPAPPMAPIVTEAELDLADYGYDTALPWQDPSFAGPNYGEGKRQAEAYLVANADFEVSSARLAHVLAARDEFTGRFQFHLDRIRAGERMASFTTPGRTSYVSAADSARFLAWLGTTAPAGAYNGASPDHLDVHAMAALMNTVLNGQVVIDEVPDAPSDPDLSAFSCPADYGLSVTKAADAGFTFTPISEWLPAETRIALEAGA